MLEESQNKYENQTLNIMDEIDNNLQELMTKFVAAYKQIEQNYGKLS